MLRVLQIILGYIVFDLAGYVISYSPLIAVIAIYAAWVCFIAPVVDAAMKHDRAHPAPRRKD